MKFVEITLHRRCTSVRFSIQPTRTPARDGRPRVRGRLVGGIKFLENGRLSDQYRIGTDTGCIVLASVVSGKTRYYVHGADSAAVNRLHYTGQSKDNIAPSPAARARHLIHDTGEGWRGGRRETVTWYQPPRDAKTPQCWVLATSHWWRCSPSTSRKW